MKCKILSLLLALSIAATPVQAATPKRSACEADLIGISLLAIGIAAWSYFVFKIGYATNDAMKLIEEKEAAARKCGWRPASEQAK